MKLHCKFTLKNTKLIIILSFVSFNICGNFRELLSLFYAFCWMASRQNGFRDQASHSRKLQTAGSQSVHWWLSYQKSVRVGLHCQAMCDHNLWTQCSLYGLNLQLISGGEIITHALRWIASRRDSQITHNPHSKNGLTKKKRKKKVKTGMGSPHWRMSMFHTHLRKLLSTALDMPGWRELIEQVN